MKDIYFQQKLQAREEIMQCILKSTDYIRGQDKIFKGATDSLQDAQNCVHRMVEVILNTYSCNGKTMFFDIM
jgi:hypothetical protein